MTCLQAALQNGADAVYLGLDALNMRVRSGINFTARTLPVACRRAHAAGAKVYLTLNSIVFDSRSGRSTNNDSAASTADLKVSQ